MIIECINCNKKFNVNSELIPSTGRTIQCGSCNHVWFFNPSSISSNQIQKTKKLQENNVEIKKTHTVQKKKQIDQKMTVSLELEMKMHWK